MILFKDLILRISKEKNIPSSLINIFLLINWKKKNIFHIFKDTIIDEEEIATYLGKKGYTIKKENISAHEQSLIRK